jgi:hypothetical protein
MPVEYSPRLDPRRARRGRRNVMAQIARRAVRSDSSDDAYAPLEVSDVVPLLSYLCFSGSLVAKPLSRLLPETLRRYPWGLLSPAAIAAGLALVGMLLALWSLRGAPARRGLGRIGVFLNGVVFALTSLAVLALMFILRR